MNRRLGAPLMVLCLLVAGGLRFSNLVNSPPGLHFDEAANAILAGDVGLRGERPLFISEYSGKEVLFFYMAGGLMRLLGETTFSLRLTAAFAGLLTVAATYWMSQELVKNRRLALLAAAALAISFWHLLFSRMGFRAISQPLLQALAVAAIFRGLRRVSRTWIVTGGAALGLVAYTYLGARLFPLPLALALTPLLFSRGAVTLRGRQQLFLLAGTALLVVTPLLLTFYANPGTFWVRINQVFPGGVAATTLANSYLKSLGMFFISGDPSVRFNIPGLPILGWFWGLLLVAGWILAIWRWGNAEDVVTQSGYLLLALIPPMMLLPTALAVGEIVPSNIRAIGLLPFIYLLPALSAVAAISKAWRWIVDRRLTRSWPFPGFKPDPFGVVVILLLLSGGLTAGDTLFRKWAARSDLYYASAADLVNVSRYLNSQTAENEQIYLASLHYRHPTISFLSDAREHLKWLPGSQAIVFPAEGAARYLFPWSSPAAEWAASLLANGAVFRGPTGPAGEPDFMAYRLTATPDLTPSILVDANFSNVATMLGYDLGSLEGGHVPLTLYWRIDQSPETSLAPFVYLEDIWRFRWSQQESTAYPAEQWAPGEIFIQRVTVPLRPGAPAGTYRLLIGIIDLDSGRQLAFLDRADRYGGVALIVEGLQLPAAPTPDPLPSPPTRLNLPAGPGLTLLGYERNGDVVANAGQPISLAFWWHSAGPLDERTIRLELVRPDNTGLILDTTQPVHGSQPFAEWSQPRFLIDHQTPRIPATFPAGKYLLRMRLMDGGGKSVLTADLGDLFIESGDRLFSPPRAQFPQAATFGREIGLLGYNLEQTEARRFTLTLIWQALVEPAAEYSIFVHVLDNQGACCIWQKDSPPQGGGYPTDRWLAQEIVLDSYVIELPQETPVGGYPLEVGLNIGDTGRRLLLETPSQRSNDALLLRPLIVE